MSHGALVFLRELPRSLAVAVPVDAPLFDDGFHLPTRRDLVARLVSGAAIFGIGCGLGGDLVVPLSEPPRDGDTAM